jgi:hypothetical protein
MRIIDGWKPVYITAGFIVVIITVMSMFGHDIVKPMTKDRGIIQIATVSLLCVAVVLALLRVIAKARPRLGWAEGVCILSVYAMREMDFHRIFASEHVTKLKFYTGPFALAEKLVGGMIMLFFIVVFIHFCMAHLPHFIGELKRKLPRAWYFIVWGFLLLGAQLIDKPRLFKGFIKSLTEETMELGAAMMMIFIVLSFFPEGGLTVGCKRR